MAKRRAEKKAEEKAAHDAKFLSEAEMEHMQSEHVLNVLTEEREKAIVADFKADFSHNKIVRYSCAIDGRRYAMADLTLVSISDLPLDVMQAMYHGPNDLTATATAFYDLSNLESNIFWNFFCFYINILLHLKVCL